MIKNIICIGCPLGCLLIAEVEFGVVSHVTGQSCKRGESYAKQEAIQPLRILTGNMRASGCRQPFSIITNKPITKDLLLACAAELKKHHPEPPIYSGDVVIENILGTGCDVIATQDCMLINK